MSALHFLIIIAVVGAKSLFPNYKNENTFRPFVTSSERARICTELCLSGLGGDPCGENCLDILPKSLPIEPAQSTNTSNDNRTRSDACPVLCSNKLGFPLCQCKDPDASKTNFVEVCSHFCVQYDYQIYGCQSCEIYKRMKNGMGNLKIGPLSTQRNSNVDWDQWCRQQCRVGNGGAACNCDILPFSL